MGKEERAERVAKLVNDLVRTTDPKFVANGKQKVEDEHGKTYQELVRYGERMQLKAKYRGR